MNKEKTIEERLRIMADMISLGERISWGGDSALMREAADELEKRDRIARQDIINAVIAEVEGMKKTDPGLDWSGDNDPQWWHECGIGYNQALADVVNKLSTLTK